MSMIIPDVPLYLVADAASFLIGVGVVIGLALRSAGVRQPL